MKNLQIYVALFLSLSLTSIASTLVTQASNKLPDLTVAYYDCNASSALTESDAEKYSLLKASVYIYQNILGDSSSPNLSFISYGFADSLTFGTKFSGQSFCLPDTGQPDLAHYIIASTITGSKGKYVLTVSVLDGYSYVHGVDKSAQFNSATDGDVKSACLSAVAQLLPLSNAILVYQQSLRNTNPSLCINPQITVTPSKPNIPVKGTTKVSFGVTDCDGVPLANRQLSLDAKHGTFDPPTVNTDNKGVAQATYTGGKKDDVDILTATMTNVITVMHDTISPAGAAPMIIGDPQTEYRAMLTFNYLYSKTTCKNQLLGDLWNQRTSFGAYSATGFMIGYMNSIEMSFGGGRDNAWCKVGAYYHELEIYRSPSVCPKISWHMNGKSYTLLATGGESSGSPFLGLPGFVAGNPYYRSSVSIDFPLDSIEMYYQFYWADDSWSDGKNCHGATTIDTYSSKHLSAFGPGKTMWSEGDPGFYFSPTFEAGDSTNMVGFTASVTDVQITGKKDTELQVAVTKLTATALPLRLSTSAAEQKSRIPTTFTLFQNYPNPFNPSTVINYQVGRLGKVSLKVYDVLGKEVATLVDEVKAPGSYSAFFVPTNLASCVYFYRLQSGSFTATKKLIFLQ
jgi:hypothetical protein